MNKKEINKYVFVVALFFSIYVFILALNLISASFGLASANQINELMNKVSNPFVGVFIGILVTSLVQSSSSTTSLTVGLVVAGAIKLELGIFIVMGANIGTSITNTLVSLSHITRRNEFERAFAAAVVHDFFNIIVVFMIFPLEYFFKYLTWSSKFFTDIFKNIGGLKVFKPVDLITKPVVNSIISLFKENFWIIGGTAIVLLFFALRYIVIIVKKLVLGRIKRVFGTILFKNYGRAMFSGTVITSIVQSSSVTTSLAVPFAAARILTIEQIFPYTLGANIGTTVTALLAALSIGKPIGLQIAIAHLIFNITGIVLIAPIKKVPIFLAKKLAYYALKNRLIPFFYVVIQFFIIPLIFIYIWR